MTNTTVWGKIASVTGKALMATLNTVGEMAIAQEAEKEKMKERIIDLKNESAKAEYNSKVIDKNDLDNLRSHILRIMEEKDTWAIKYYGKELLVNEDDKTEEQNKKDFYKYIIEYGI